MKIIKIKDYYGQYQEVPVSDEVYEEYHQMRNDFQRVHRREVRNRDWTPMDEPAKRDLFCGECLEDEYFRHEDIKALYRAMEKLSATQKRRLLLHYTENLTFREIALREGCHMNAVYKSVTSALKTLRALIGD